MTVRARVAWLAGMALVAFAAEAACASNATDVKTRPAVSTPRIDASVAPVDGRIESAVVAADASSAAVDTAEDEEWRPRGFAFGIADAGADAASAAVAGSGLDEATLERRTFREVLVGKIALPPLRLTWVLLRGKARVRLRLFCQTSQPELNLKLDGREGDLSSWSPPVQVTFEGTRTNEGVPIRLQAPTDGSSIRSCVDIAPVLNLTCRPAQARVLREGAKLIGDNDRGWHWSPPSAEDVRGLSCQVARVPEDPGIRAFESPLRGVSQDWPLMFVEARPDKPGIEWAFDNSDTILQQGAYRWLPAGP